MATPDPARPLALGGLFAASLLVLIAVYLWAGPSDSGGPVGAFETVFENKINNKVLEDALSQYQFVVKNGNKNDVCMHAGVVKMAYQMAEDADNYKKWQTIETRDCAHIYGIQ